MGFRKLFVREAWQEEKRKRCVEAKKLLETSEVGSIECQKAVKQRAIELMGQARLIKIAYRLFGSEEMDLISKWSRARGDQEEDSYVRTIREYHNLKKELLQTYSKKIASRVAVEICSLRYEIRPMEKANEYVEMMSELLERLNETQIDESFKLTAGNPVKKERKYFETLLELGEIQESYYNGSPDKAFRHLQRKYALMRKGINPLDEKIAEEINKV